MGNLKNVLCFDVDFNNPSSFQNHLKIGEKNAVPSKEIERDHLATIIYTSGTTGLPKGVELSHYNIFSNVSSIVEMYHPYYNQADTTLSILPWAHAYGQTCELHAGISQGLSIGISGGASTFLKDLSEVKPTVLIGVPG